MNETTAHGSAANRLFTPVEEPDTLLLRACKGLATERTPLWLMGQAGPCMPRHWAAIAQHSSVDINRAPDLAAEITLLPVDEFGFDAAPIFTDTLLPLAGMGLSLEAATGEAPCVANPVRSAYDVDILATPTAEEHLSSSLQAIRIVTRELAGRGIPTIGLGSAPFTLACYAIEGGRPLDFARVKSFMYSEPAAWKRLMTKLVTVQADNLTKQAQAGAAILQVSDPLAGLALGQADYLRFVQPYNRTLFGALKHGGTPVISYSAGTSAYLSEVAAEGGDVVAVDWRMPLAWCRQQIGFDQPIQGNLDPVALLSPWRELKYQIDAILAEAAGRPGHVFSVGQDILAQTPADAVRRLVDYVRESSARPI